jgi:hypothetical protein
VSRIRGQSQKYLVGTVRWSTSCQGRMSSLVLGAMNGNGPETPGAEYVLRSFR